jgi:hypothetical protein
MHRCSLSFCLTFFVVLQTRKIQDPDFAFRGATALMVGVGLPATLFVAHLSLGSHPLTAAFATALLPVMAIH